MPTYDYECQSCSHTFEVFQSMKDDPLKECPECGKEVKRLIGGGLGVIFKGKGFYTTDYKNSPATTGAINTNSNTESKSSTTTESKTETKTETKTDAKGQKAS